MNVAEQKSRVRREVQLKLSQMTAEDKRIKSAAISQALIQFCSSLFPSHESADSILLTYMPFRNEVDVTPLTEWCWSRGIRVALPRIGPDRRMTLHLVGSYQDMEEGAWGIREPKFSTPAPGRLSLIKAALVPGVAFDPSLGRLGYGGGYYDRLLSRWEGARPLLLAAAFGVQLVSGLPMEEHDFKLDKLFTERQNFSSFQGRRRGIVTNDSTFTHFNEQGRARMVDISEKQETKRTAAAATKVTMKPETLQMILQGRVAKGDVMAVAQVAGIMAAKKTSEWIPMCHPLALTGVDIRFNDNGRDELHIEAEARTTGPTGVEMEALTAVSAAALTVYDMCKALEKEMVIGPTVLLNKTGGKSGDFNREK